MITIIDVAKYADVSKSTVSRVITGNGYVSETSKQKVEKAMSELGYTPNILARQFQSGESKTIGFITPSVISTTGRFLEVFMTAAKEYGYSINLYLTEEDKKKELDALNQMKYKHVDALFILTRINDWNIIKKYQQYGPISTWNRIEEDWIYSSYFDHYEAYLRTLNYLYKNGYRNIGHVLSNKKNLNTNARKKAITEFYHQNNMSLDKLWLIDDLKDLSHSNNGNIVAQKWFESKSKPEVIAFFSDHVAAQFISEIEKEGYSTPNDVGVIGFDNSEISNLMHITTIDYSIEEQAFNSFIYLYNQLNNKVIPEKKLTCQIIERKTIKKVYD